MEIKIKGNSFVLTNEPKDFIKDGLLVVFDRETDTETRYATCDIHKGQKVYSKPDEPRKVEAIYKRIL